jgi:hypothetical protein
MPFLGDLQVPIEVLCDHGLELGQHSRVGRCLGHEDLRMDPTYADVTYATVTNGRRRRGVSPIRAGSLLCGPTPGRRSSLEGTPRPAIGAIMKA